MSIRTRLLLLVFAVWLPSVAGFGLLAKANYEREELAFREHLRQLALSINSVVERELDKRAVLARALASSNAVRDGDIAAFLDEARMAVEGSESWALWVDRHMLLANTRRPQAEPLRMPRADGAPWTTDGPLVHFSPSGAVVRHPVIAVFAAESRVQPPRYNVGVGFEPAVLQAILEEHDSPPGGAASIIDDAQRVMARSRDPERWLGRSATGEVLQLARAGQSGFTESFTLDGIASLSYVAPSNRYGWTVVLGLPRATLTSSANRLTVQAFGAAALLLCMGLPLALLGARRIAAPVRSLRDAALLLGRGEVPPALRTELLEADAVGAALHEAGRARRDATLLLEQRVAAAVEQTRVAQARLLEAQKHEAIGRLTGGIAHDFNNLLQTISTAHHALARHAPEGPPKRLLEGAVRATTKATELIRQLTTFGRTQPLAPQPIDLRDFLLKNQELVRKAVGEHVRLQADIAPGLPPLHADPVQLELAVLNLVFNARDALGTHGGRIMLSARMALPQETEYLEPCAQGYVCLQVADDGPGMDAATQERAFEPYFTTKPVGVGSGLGLAQARAFARQSGGDISLHSLVGEGTQLRLLLPGSAEAPAPEPGAAPPAAAVRRPLRVLMAEDDPLVSSVVVPVLQEAGHQVTLCAGADEAQALLQSGAPCDVLFTDIVMPGRMNGADLVHWCRAERPGLPVVAATGYAPRQAALPVPLLFKPYVIDALLEALQRAVEPG